MTNVIQFPNKNFNKNTKQVVTLEKSKRNSYILLSSLFSLVLALSVVNQKMDSGSKSPTQGMRGIASIDNSEFNFNNKKLLALINSKKSRKLASLGITPESSDKFALQELQGLFRITYASNGFIRNVQRTSVNSTFENEVQFNAGLLNNYKQEFGAHQIKLASDEIIVTEDGLTSTYHLINNANEVYATATVQMTKEQDLISISVNNL